MYVQLKTSVLVFVEVFKYKYKIESLSEYRDHEYLLEIGLPMPARFRFK